MYVIKTNDLKAATNTALSAQQFDIEVHIHTESKKAFKSDLFASVNEEVEAKEIEAGLIFLKAPKKKLHTFKGDKVYLNYGDMKSKYDSLVLTDNSLTPWFDYYDSIVKKLGGYTSYFLWRE